MAKKFGKRGKKGQAAADPRELFGAPQLPRHAGPPASSAPLADYLAQGWPGVDQGYVVLPRSLAESMSLPWQQHLVNLLAQFHQAHGRLTWPVYRVVPSRHERLVDLDEEQLAEAGYLVEIDVDGEMVYRERSGRKVENPRETTVLVSCLDPIPPRTAPPAPQPDQRASGERQRTPAPMNIGPQPVWRTVGNQQEQRAQQPPAPQAQPAPADQPRQAQPARPPAPAEQPPPQAPPARPAGDQSPPPSTAEPAAPPPDHAEADTDTPPRGTPRPPATGTAERGWFDELPEGSDQAQAQAFGPSGEPTEIPYRYRP